MQGAGKDRSCSSKWSVTVRSFPPAAVCRERRPPEAAFVLPRQLALSDRQPASAHFCLCFLNHYHHHLCSRAYHQESPCHHRDRLVSPAICRSPYHARCRGQAKRARHREHQEVQGARADRKTRRKKNTWTRQGIREQ